MLDSSQLALPGWKERLNAVLPLYGHRNWIVVADSAYPAQSNPGIETIVAGGDQIAVLEHVLAAVGQCKHIRANVYADKELAYVAESDAPGVLSYCRGLEAHFQGRNRQLSAARADHSQARSIGSALSHPAHQDGYEHSLHECLFRTGLRLLERRSGATASQSALCRLRLENSTLVQARKRSSQRFLTRKEVRQMKLNRRDVLKSIGGVCSAAAFSRIAKAQSKTYVGTRESLRSYRVPEWFRDAKFGIWSHWGPQSAIEDGDWYARNMYIQGQPQYDYHVQTYGHPSKVGYKDLMNVWKADKWDPEHLMGLYKKAGAKYFFSMGVHHDNFDLWDSKYTALERGEDGAEERCGWPVGRRGAQKRPALWRERAPVDQLQVVQREPQRRQGRFSGGRSV